MSQPSPTPPKPEPTGLTPVGIALWLGGAAGVWLVVDVLRRVLS
jgi:hypothetical protein